MTHEQTPGREGKPSGGLTPEELELLTRGERAKKAKKDDVEGEISEENEPQVVAIDLSVPGSIEFYFTHTENWRPFTEAHRISIPEVYIDGLPVKGATLYCIERQLAADEEIAKDLGNNMVDLLEGTETVPYQLIYESGPSLGFVKEMQKFAKLPEIKAMAAKINGQGGWSVTVNQYGVVGRFLVKIAADTVGVRSRIFPDFESAQKFLREVMSDKT